MNDLSGFDFSDMTIGDIIDKVCGYPDEAVIAEIERRINEGNNRPVIGETVDGVSVKRGDSVWIRKSHDGFREVVEVVAISSDRAIDIDNEENGRGEYSGFDWYSSMESALASMEQRKTKSPPAPPKQQRGKNSGRP